MVKRISLYIMCASLFLAAAASAAVMPVSTSMVPPSIGPHIPDDPFGGPLAIGPHIPDDPFGDPLAIGPYIPDDPFKG